MILVATYLSSFVRRVAITMRLYGLEYEHRPLKAFGDDKETMSGKHLSQANVTAVFCWSFARTAKPKLTESTRAPGLDDIAARAEQKPEFRLNAPEF